MPEFHYVTLRTHVHATEDPERVLHAFRNVIGDPEAEVTEVKLTGHHGNPIVRLEHEIKRKKDVDRFFQHLAGTPGIAELFLRQRDARLDAHGIFYARFAKQDAHDGRLVIAFDEDTIQIRAKVRAYPSKREIAMAQLEEFLEGLVRTTETDAARPQEDPDSPA